MSETCASALRVEEIRPAAMMEAKRSCVIADREYLLERRDEWVDVDCPACGEDAAGDYGSKDGFAYVECQDCGTVYTSPRPSLALLERFYAQSKNYAYWNKHIFPASESARRERIFKPRVERLVDYCRQFGFAGGTLLEVGAAFGTFCEEVRHTGHFERIIALEPTPDLAQTCRERGFEVWEQPVEKTERSRVADVVAAFEVIEHLFSPSDFLGHVRRMLKPSGMLVLSCPNVRGFDVSALREQSSTFDHEHLNYFHPESLPLLLAREGFTTEVVETPGRLDAELVRGAVMAEHHSLDRQPFLQTVLLDRWDELGRPFQDFLAQHRLSSHLWVVARRKEPGGDSGGTSNKTWSEDHDHKA
ncbi:bifunctional 3-demethylubiquinone-9 3-methyltransferase/ 2-octaprenyl-6-hydroxy phenol methylase [Planctomycetes bacterium Pan216]|uniref:Bifunctional 3-demethylubiquinone-9 3-methyltransferase/ 2-octaprenyl-6-hydroxy phenol methylase n=1 Tax=Kolteria novifilia TaxID=2527975 RepID=A0A518B3H8_9BACT|nr:bifunctional 3-demethylubiquinone-9 3-methyltransferase/ 2-octaprenyl-6-hydroxy phenol methylase [Planctomycetes bacterium Pan216]